MFTCWRSCGIKSKLNSIESKTSEVLIYNKIGHEDFITIINEETNYLELKECIRMMNSQRCITEKINLMKTVKRSALMRLLNPTQIINSSLKSKI